MDTQVIITISLIAFMLFLPTINRRFEKEIESLRVRRTFSIQRNVFRILQLIFMLIVIAMVLKFESLSGAEANIFMSVGLLLLFMEHMFLDKEKYSS